MSEPKFTPGPWKWSDEYFTINEEGRWALVGKEGYGVLSCDNERSLHTWRGDNAVYLNSWNDTIREANANLIAAAPELYEALEAYITQDEIAEGYGAGIGGETKEKALTALAKARGES